MVQLVRATKMHEWCARHDSFVVHEMQCARHARSAAGTGVIYWSGTWAGCPGTNGKEYTLTDAAAADSIARHSSMDAIAADLPHAEQACGRWLVSPRFDQVNIRQLEYHPAHDSLMAVGTLDGEVMVLDHKQDVMQCYSAECAASAEDSVLGLCWYVWCFLAEFAAGQRASFAGCTNPRSAS